MPAQPVRPVRLALHALWIATLVLTVGCSPGAATPPGAGDGPTPSVDILANGRKACQTVQSSVDTYGIQIIAASDKARPAMAQKWSGTINAAAHDVDDSTLRIALLGLADVVRGWAVRPPDRSGVNGLRHDLTVACRPYLNDNAS
jgi:hypothetical protein